MRPPDPWSTHARRVLAGQLPRPLSLAHHHWQQRASRVPSALDLAQVVPAPSEQDVRIEAMIQRDAGNRGAAD
jgi:hypothetical protein